MTDARTWQALLARSAPPPFVLIVDSATRSAVERWHLDRARARLLGALVGRIMTAPEPDDLDELAATLARRPLPWWDAVPCSHVVPGTCDFCREDRR